MKKKSPQKSSELPKAVREQLLDKPRKMEPQIIAVLSGINDIEEGAMDLNTILEKLYRIHHIIVRRVTVNATLNRLVKDGKIKKIAGKKGVFSAK